MVRVSSRKLRLFLAFTREMTIVSIRMEALVCLTRIPHYCVYVSWKPLIGHYGHVIVGTYPLKSTK